MATMSPVPSSNMIENACNKIIINGRRMLQAKVVYIGTDHGGGVLIKIAFFWDQHERKMIKINLDFDTSGYSAANGGKAIK